MKLSFVIPGDPVGVNRGFTGGERPFAKTPEARVFVEAVATYGALARRAARAEAIECPVEVWIRVYFGSDRPDADGPVKPILDALQVPRLSPRRAGAGIYVNDRQVADYHVSRRIDPSSPRIELDVEARPDLQVRVPVQAGDPPAPRRALLNARAAVRAGRLVSSTRRYTP